MPPQRKQSREEPQNLARQIPRYQFPKSNASRAIMEVPDDNNERPHPLDKEPQTPNHPTICIRLAAPNFSGSQEECQPGGNTSPGDQRHIIYLRFTPHEKTQLDNGIFHWGYRGGGREEAEELSQNPTPFVEEIALKLFQKWSFTVGVKRALVLCLGVGLTGTAGEVLQVFRQSLDRRGDDPLQQLPEDCRRRRVDTLLGDEINAAFFSRFGASGAESEFGQYIVSPHPEEVRIWRLLAYQAWRNSRAWRAWPGVHEAAAFADNVAIVEHDEFPYYELWDPTWTEPEPTSDDEPDSDSELEDIETRTDFDQDLLEDDLEPGWSSPWWPTILPRAPRIRQRQKDIRKRYIMFEDADVWDVWILCQMVRCQEAIWGFDQNPGTEMGFGKFEQLEVFKETWVRREGSEGRGGDGGFLQRRLALPEEDKNSLVDLKQRWPLPLPRDFIEFAEYGEYRFEEIDDKDVISSLLTSADLSITEPNPDAQNAAPDIEWDLIYLNSSRRDPLRQDADREHLHHTLYTSDDYIQWEYDKGGDLPGLCHPCECIKLSPSELAQRNREEDEEYEKILKEGIKFINGEGSSKAPGRNPADTGEYKWRSKYNKAKLKKDMREKHGRWREFPDEHYDYKHAGGNVVFNRRRVEDVPEFVKGLDRFWVDWNDCMLIMGAGEEDDEDGFGNRLDEDTIYILETLPGIKRRWGKMRKA